MDSTEKIILNGSLNKSFKDENMALNVSLSGSKKILSDGDVSNSISMHDEYINERKNSNIFRLSININPFCTNVLFNPFTEIVKYSDNNVTFLNYSTSRVNIPEAIGKTDIVHPLNGWTAYDAIRDTQLSNDRCGYTYHCGIDIFNNHIIRNKSFKSVNYSDLYSNSALTSYEEVYGTIGYKNRYIQEETDTPHVYLRGEDFNTIDDYLRDRNGVIISDLKMTPITGTNKYDSDELRIPLHLYQKHDVLSFEDCINEKLLEDNGWFGFENPALFDSLMLTTDDKKLKSNSTSFSVSPTSINACPDASSSISISLQSVETDDGKEELMGINKVVNNKKYCEFIDMYPTRELFSFTPVYNEHKKRYEKNWNYCLTYPSKSITKPIYLDKQSEEYKNSSVFPFFKELSDGTISLKAAMFDEYTVDDDGTDVVTIYSICQHGLKKGDNVNIYKGDELVYNNGLVSRIIDKYIFQIVKETYDISKRWIDIDDVFSGGTTATISILLEDGSTSSITCGLSGEYVDAGGKSYRIAASNRCNIDPEAQDISFKRVLNGVECEYYVRVFSRLPNFKFANAEINDYNLYGDSGLNLIDTYSQIKWDFENHISNNSFSETSYGDKNTEILYTDDIDVSFLKDNLGRPLSEIYFTIVKNNKGYKEWYRKNGNRNSSEIELSRCFGYNSSSFLFNDYYRNYPVALGGIKDVRDINATDRQGLLYKYNKTDAPDDEIKFANVTDYYGDICCYCPVECDEYSLQSVMDRFNTVQRELSLYGHNYDFAPERFNSLTEDGNTNDVIMFHDEIINDESGYIGDESLLNDLYESFNENRILNHSSFHLGAHTGLKDTFKYHNMLNFKEGYYYKMHYKIPLKTVSQAISVDNGIKYDMYSIVVNDGTLKIRTVDKNSLSINDKIILYDKVENEFFYLTVSKIHTQYYFECSVKKEDLTDGLPESYEIKHASAYSLMKKSIGTPEYAKIIKDGSCAFYWRDIISNGVEENDGVIYPFTNGAFYINKQINFFLRRQDPKKENLGIAYSNSQFYYVPEGESLPSDYYNNQYYDSEEIETC